MRAADVLVRAGALIAAGLVGAVLALAGDAALRDEPASTTTVVRDAFPVEGEPAREGGVLSINEIYEQTQSGVVQINTTSVVSRVVPDPFGFGFPEQQRRQGLGSGFVLDKSGHIVTNYHVVKDVHENSGQISVSFSNREGVEARIVGVDEATDVAVLKVDQQSQALTPLRLGNSDRIKVGDPVVAIGNPFGWERTVTAGIVSALQRRIVSPGNDPIDRVIQIDAAINQGNSGGPLLDRFGAVVGVNTAIFTGSPTEQGFVGIGFAIPVNTVKEIAGQLIEDGKVDRAFLGVEVQELNPRVARLFRLPVQRGLLVTRVIEGSAAEKAGIRAGTTNVVVDGVSYRVGGDIIVAIDGQRTTEFVDLGSVVGAKKPGDEIEVELFREDEREKVEVKLGRRTETPSSD
ncbi:MAG: trypsin-like peptidase domain-containing protein [Thermoleophilia bacterium]|nr:trypsin-like peptidase domain-containing protein [Thermoleophilia bacterium]